MTTIALRKEVEKAMIKTEIEFDTWPDFVNKAITEKIERGKEKIKSEQGCPAFQSGVARFGLKGS